MNDPTIKPTFANLWRDKKLTRTVSERMPSFAVDESHIPVDYSMVNALSSIGNKAVAEVSSIATREAKEAESSEVLTAMQEVHAHGGFPLPVPSLIYHMSLPVKLSLAPQSPKKRGPKAKKDPYQKRRERFADLNRRFMLLPAVNSATPPRELKSHPRIQALATKIYNDKTIAPHRRRAAFETQSALLGLPRLGSRTVQRLFAELDSSSL